MTISSFVGYWWYTAAFVTPMESAIICNDVPLTPCRANRSNAAVMMRSCAALWWTGPMRVSDGDWVDATARG